MKISVIMQSYLGDYPGSRSNPEYKFIRAVYSFLMQEYDNKELLIVSDGCKITENLYNLHFKHFDEIKYIYIDKKSPKMYDGDEDSQYFRGLPRKVGNDTSTGDIICYLDSDDYLKKTYLSMVHHVWSRVPDSIKWIVNRSWYDNIAAVEDSLDPSLVVLEDLSSKTPIKINGLESMWVEQVVNIGYAVTSTALITHRNNCGVEWGDSIGNHEDQEFYKKIEGIGGGAYGKFAGYVRCNVTGKWDI